ncbi:unnamed protein product [Prunus armeniaca]
MLFSYFLSQLHAHIYWSLLHAPMFFWFSSYLQQFKTYTFSPKLVGFLSGFELDFNVLVSSRETKPKKSLKDQIQQGVGSTIKKKRLSITANKPTKEVKKVVFNQTNTK